MPSKKVYWKNPAKYRKQSDDYRLSNPEWHRKSNAEWAKKKRSRDPLPGRAASNKYREANKEVRQKATKEWVKRVPGTYLFYNAKQRAKKLGLPFNLVRTDMVIPEVCPVLGIPIDATINGRRGFHPNSPSIDRVVPALGYVVENVRVISNLANVLKRTETTPDNLRKVADYIERESARVHAELAA